MVNWRDPQVIKLCGVITDKVFTFLLGVSCWHLIVTLKHVEVPLLTRNLRWRWAYLFYLGGRYFLIISQITAQWYPNPMAAALTSMCGGIAGVCASGNLVVRSTAMWRRASTFVVSILGLLEIGHWAIMLAVLFVPAILNSNPALQRNAPPSSSMHVSYYLYTFVFDLIILVLITTGLLHPRVQGSAHSSRLWSSLRSHGIIYFAVTMGVNIPFLVVAWCDLNAYMTIIFAAFSVSISVIASSAAVTSLLELKVESSPNSASTHDGAQAEHISGSLPNVLTTNMDLSLATMSVVSDLHSEGKFRLGEASA